MGHTIDPGSPVELTDLQDRFGDVIRRRRLNAGMGQEKLADQAGIHRTHISLLERGKLMPSLAIVFKLATALGVSMITLIGEMETEDGSAAEPPPVPRGRPRKATGTNEKPTNTKAEDKKGGSVGRRSKKR
jgi:XRE family transcriptional regulator, regulator of sulfur utilization